MFQWRQGTEPLAPGLTLQRHVGPMAIQYRAFLRVGSWQLALVALRLQDHVIAVRHRHGLGYRRWTFDAYTSRRQGETV